MRRWTLAPLALAAPEAAAHAAHAGTWWSLDPWVIGSLVLLAVALRPRRRLPFALALAALFLALVWPLDVLAESSLAAHMVQHMLLIAVAAPLLVLARPAMPWLKGRRGAGRLLRGAGFLARPAAAFTLHSAAIWAGHAPVVIAWTLAYRWFHVLEHFALAGSAALFWWAIARGGRNRAGAAAVWTLALLVHTGLLGALLTFAPRPLYAGFGLEDQQLAGLVMWVPGGFIYLAAGLAHAAAWLGRAESSPPAAVATVSAPIAAQAPCSKASTRS